MCGRYSLTPTRESIIDEFNIGVVTDIDHVRTTDRYNTADTLKRGEAKGGAR